MPQGVVGYFVDKIHGALGKPLLPRHPQSVFRYAKPGLFILKQ